MGLATVEISLGLLISCLLVYIFYGRRFANNEYAWLHLIQRISSKELDSYDLESELRSIIHSRDEIVQDSFDKLIQKAIIMDLSEKIDRKALFDRAAEKLASSISLSEKQIAELLNQREMESSTALIPEVAVPHIIIKGEDHFEILIARSQEGIFFCKEAPNIKAIFIIIGSKDQRRLHLQALAAIGQIIQNPDFDKRWKEARSENHLRDILLLSDRRRS